jgi:hypothetical protein
LSLPVAALNAATASARTGADTRLIGGYGFLGSVFTEGNETFLTRPSVGGIGKEVVDALMVQGAARRCPGDPPNYPTRRERFHANDPILTPAVWRLTIPRGRGARRADSPAALP